MFEAKLETKMTNEFMVVERLVAGNERNDADNNNPDFFGVGNESMMLRNYGTQGWSLVSVISEQLSSDQTRRVFYLQRSV